jgi:CRP-like cAMP-binding protein
MTPAENPFVRKLRRGGHLSTADEDMLSGLFSRPRLAEAGRDLALEGDERTSLFLIVSGWACHSKQLANGARQIISLLLPGDLCQPFGIFPQDMSDSLSALTSVLVASVSPRHLRAAGHSRPAIEEALWWDLQLARELQNERVVSLGRRSAIERLSHLFCELHIRLAMVGMVQGPSMEMPVRQAQLADLLGLSAVHVNRSLQELRTQGLISLRDKTLVIHDLHELMELAQFDASYLHLGDRHEAKS